MATAGVSQSAFPTVPMQHRAVPVNLIGLAEKQLAGMRLAVDAEVKQVVTCWLQTVDISFYCARTRASAGAIRIKCFNVNDDLCRYNILHL